MGYPITLTTATQTMIVRLSGDANGGYPQTEKITLDALTYNTEAELAAELQQKLDLAFGQDTILAYSLAAGVIQLETCEQGGNVLQGDLVVGLTAPDGTVDTASSVIGFNIAGSAAADGVHGNDRFTIDLGLSAYRVTGDEEPIDLEPQVINIDASTAIDLQTLVDDVNAKILDNQYLSGLVEAVVHDDGITQRLRIQTTKQGADVMAEDLVLANAFHDPLTPLTDPPNPALAHDTLRALGFYRDVNTGISAPPQPAVALGQVDLAGGYVVNAGVNDQISVDLGAWSSLDGTNHGPVTLTLIPGAYANGAAMAAEINAQISLSPLL
jgi:hypothetical protein